MHLGKSFSFCVESLHSACSSFISSSKNSAMAAGVAAFAGKAIATSVISYIVNKAFDYLKDNKKAEGLKSTKQRLERLLPQIQVVFDAVDTEQIKDQSTALDAWLWQLRGAVEEAEDALDELDYYKIEEEVKMQESKVRGSLRKYKGKLIQQFNHAFNAGSLKRLKAAVMALDDVAAGVERFFHVLNQFGNNERKNHKQDVEFKNWRKTTILPPSLLLGREEERKNIVKWLTQPKGDAVENTVSNVPVFSIVGIGGIGKTALAQLICDNNEVKKYFNCIIWISVSDDFDIETLTRMIIQGITKKGTTLVGLSALHKALKEKLSSKTFLLALDDVWNDERVQDWEKFVCPLKYGKKGSKILLTTRMQSVADVAARTVQVECQSLRLRGLEESDLLVILNRHAFFGVNLDDYRNLQQISKKMVKKLSGSPLAAKVLGGLLNSNKDSTTWNKILASSVHRQQGKEGIMTVLRLSYQHLPTHLQACFRYCSLFHKDHEFTKKELVSLWMGSGLIQQVDDMMPEEVGMEYLNILTRKSFFDIKPKPCASHFIRANLYDEYYEERLVMHDLLHDLACSASVSECTRVDINFSGHIPKTVRHIHIVMVSPTVVEDISHAKQLRTLLMHFEDQDQEEQEHILISKVLNVAKSLRVLSLTTNSPCKLPDAVGGLMHLRYLSLTWGRKKVTNFCWFPQPVYKLYNLQVMKFDNPQLTAPEKGEMEGVCNLINLRHLHLSHGIVSTIPYVGKLTSLHELYGFCIKQQGGYTISELKNLTNICHLYVSGLDMVNSTEEAAEVMLDQKKYLSAVTFSWSPGSSNSCEPHKAEQLLDKLQPHPNLCKLKIDGYPGSRSPCWLQNPALINLTYVYLCDCKRLERLPPLGQLAFLQYLYIINLESVECVESSFYGREKPSGLQFLKLLEIESMPKCVEWVGLEGENLFPRLDTLIVRNCELLRRLPSVPISIQHVEIHHAGLCAMPTFFVSSDTTSSSLLDLALSKLMISDCQNLETLWHGCSLSALEELSIQQCANLSCEDSFGSLCSLKILDIVNCPRLMTREVSLPPSMRAVTLGLCGDAERPLVHSLKDLNSLELLFLDGCAMPDLPSEVFACLAGLTTMALNDCAITALPSAKAFARLTSLKNLFLWNCKELISINGIQGITSLMSLAIHGCNKITAESSVQMVEASSGLSGLALEFDELDIDNPSLLFSEPLQSISSVKKLRIVGGAELTHLPEEWLLQNHALKELVVVDASHLLCLTPQMATLSSLESLHISNATMIRSLPDMPSSLRSLQIHNCCSELKKRCRKDKGLDWIKIAHIFNVDIMLAEI